MFWLSCGSDALDQEVKMATSGDDIKISRPISGQHFPNFEVFDAEIASSLKIIHNSNLRKKVHTE